MTRYLTKFILRYALLTSTALPKLTHKDTKFKMGAKANEAFEKLKASIANESTMAYFKPAKPIVMRKVKASFH